VSPRGRRSATASRTFGSSESTVRSHPGVSLSSVRRCIGEPVLDIYATLTQADPIHADTETMIKTYAYLQSMLVGLRENEAGQTMAEYAVVLAVITVAIVATLGFLAGGINKALSSVTAKL
jgi:Flp pilus assembly pilin Flp